MVGTWGKRIAGHKRIAEHNSANTTEAVDTDESLRHNDFQRVLIDRRRILERVEVK